jgi:hypothetical protein
MINVALRRQTALILLGLCGLPIQGTAPRYAAAVLSCATFRETVATRIRNQSGTLVRDETAGRVGIFSIEAADSDSGLTISAWYDSLSLWREGPEGRESPDAEGMLGGQWRGRLSRDGRYAPDLTPFIPDPVADVADLRGVPNDFLPVLDPSVLRRLPVQAGDGARARYAWNIKGRADTVGFVADTLKVPMRRDNDEEGSLVWDPRLGPVHWERTIRIEGRIDAKGAIKRGIRSLVTQQITVDRQADRATCAKP